MNVRDRLTRWPVVAAELGLGAVLVVALVGQAAAIVVTWGGAYWLFDSVVGLVVGVVALLRRRHRAWAVAAGLAVAVAALLTAAAAGLPAEPGLAPTLGLAVLVGSAVRALPPVPAAMVVAAGAGVVAATAFAFPASTGGVGGVTVLNAAGLCTALATGLLLRVVDARRRAIAERVRRDERLALARELHDVVAHHVTGIVLQAQAAQLATRRHADTGTLALVTASLAGIETAGSEALAAMRRVVGVLRDTDDAPPASPSPEHLDELVTRFAVPGRPVVRLDRPAGATSWPPEVTSTVYRVVQESLTNISRHAPQASEVTVRVAEDRRQLTVEVVDDAPPVPARRRPHGGYGLVGMRERVETLGGTIRFGPRPGAGWAVQVTLPVGAREPR
ncbi:sensor histidine kinase [Plantactinospora sonchi]|uniref:histidine kinase n=1 Tax=Plantactinospora sonchi TaxID=1544735 RepID=A0ABU7RZ21_9ACTN